MVSDSHTSDLTDFSNENEDEILGSSSASAVLGVDVLSAFNRDWLKDFTECFSLLVHPDKSTTYEIFHLSSLLLASMSPTSIVYLAN